MSIPKHRVQHLQLQYWAQTLLPRKYLEIGARAGDSATIVAATSPKTHLYIIDWPGRGYGGYIGSEDTLRARLEQCAADRYVLCIGDSHASASCAFIKQYAPYDLIFIDGDHSYAGAKQDWLNCRSSLAQGGVLILDDICHPAHGADLSRLFQEMQEYYHCCNSWRIEKSLGVGVIQTPSTSWVSL